MAKLSMTKGGVIKNKGSKSATFTDSKTGKTSYVDPTYKSSSGNTDNDKIIAKSNGGGGGGPSDALRDLSIKLATEPTTLSSQQGQKVIDEEIIPTINDADSLQESANSYKDKTEEQDLESLLADVGTVDDRLNASAFYKDYEKSVKQLTLANKQAAQAQLSSLNSQYQDLRDQQQQSNKASNAVFKMAQLRSGEARYAPEIAAGNLQEFQSFGLRKLKQIDDEYNAAAAEVRTAMKAENYELAMQKSEVLMRLEEKFNEEIETQRAEVTKQYNEGLMIDEIIAGGITDKADLFKKLGKVVSSTDINEFWDNFGSEIAEERKEINKIMIDAKKTGASADLINQISKAESLAEAVNLAGDYLNAGTGIVGEYLFYKRQAEALGMAPVDFSTYQDADANRKKVAAGASGVPNTVMTQVDKLASSFDANQIVKDFVATQNKKKTVDAILESGIKGPADMALVFEFMKALDPTSVVREAEFDAAAKSGNIFAGWAAKFNGYLTEGGGILPESVRKDFQTLTGEKMKVAQEQYENYRSEIARKIEMKTKAYDPDTPGTEYLTDYLGSTTERLIQSEEAAEQKIIDLGKSNPQIQSAVAGFIEEFPEATNMEILQFLGIPFDPVGSDTNQASGNRPQRNNNPLNIKASEATLSYPGVKGTDPSPATDGGKFLTFESPEDGFNAAKRLIKTSGYINLTVDGAMKRWSNSGYGGEIMPEIADTKISDLTDEQLQQLIEAMAAREGYYA